MASSVKLLSPETFLRSNNVPYGGIAQPTVYGARLVRIVHTHGPTEDASGTGTGPLIYLREGPVGTIPTSGAATGNIIASFRLGPYESITVEKNPTDTLTYEGVGEGNYKVTKIAYTN